MLSRPMATRRTHRARVLAVPIVGVVACTFVEGGLAPEDAASSTTSTITSTTTTASPPPPPASTGSTTTTSSQVDSGSSSDDAASGSTGEPPRDPPTCPTARSELDLPDDSPDPQIRVLYVLPSDAPDDALDTNDTICSSVLAWTQWLSQQTSGRTLRLDAADAVLDIGFVRLPLTDAVMHGTNAAASIDTGFAYVRDRIERELRALRMIAPHKLYAVYYGGTSEYACGGGAYPPVLMGQVGAMYLGGELLGFPGCDEAPWGEPDLVPRYIEYGMLHELVHSLGLVDATALHQHSSGHAFDDAEPSPERDLMYAPRPGMDDPPWGVYDPEGLVLDLGHDDYFEPPDPAVLDLARSVFLEPMPADPMFPPGW